LFPNASREEVDLPFFFFPLPFQEGILVRVGLLFRNGEIGWTANFLVCRRDYRGDLGGKGGRKDTMGTGPGLDGLKDWVWWP